VHPLLGEKGWSLSSDYEGATGDTVNGFGYLREAYFAAQPGYDGSITVPVLWDKKTRTIVNNESAEIIRMLNSEFQEFSGNPELDLYPAELRDPIDDVNEWVYDTINNGVYRCGFAKKQAAYSRAFKKLFASLNRVEGILAENRYLTGDTFTEADVRLFTTLVRFDAVYVTHFKTNQRRITDYPNLWNYTREIYQMSGVADTVNMDHIKYHYFASHLHINPFGIVPDGPAIDFTEPHTRG